MSHLTWNFDIKCPSPSSRILISSYGDCPTVTILSVLSIDYCPEDSNENSCGIQDSGFDHGIGSDPVNQGEDEDLDDTVEVDVESVSHQDDLVEDNPVPVECSTPTRSRSCTPAPSASSRQSSPARSDTSSRGNNSSKGNIPSSPIPSTSAPAPAAPDRGSEVLSDVYLQT